MPNFVVAHMLCASQDTRVSYGLLLLMHLSMLSPRGGGGGELRAYVGHLTSTAFPTLGNLTKTLGPRVGTFAFFARRILGPHGGDFDQKF